MRYSRVCGCPIEGQIRVNFSERLLVWVREIGACPDHSAVKLTQRMTRTLQRWSHTGLDSGRWKLQEGGSIRVEDGHVVARVPLWRDEP